MPVGFDPIEEAVESEPPAKGSWAVSRLARLDTILAPVLKVFAVLAVLFGGVEYFQRIQATRVEQSLAHLRQWDEDGYRQAYGEVNALVWPVFSKEAKFIAGLPQEQQELLYANIGERVTGQDSDFDGAADKLVDDLFYFFDRAALCADQRICEFAVLEAFIGSDVEDFWRYFSSYAERRRSAGYGQYGEWTERFAQGRIARASWLNLL